MTAVRLGRGRFHSDVNVSRRRGVLIITSGMYLGIHVMPNGSEDEGMELDGTLRELAVAMGTDYFGVDDLSPAHDAILTQGGPMGG